MIVHDYSEGVFDLIAALLFLCAAFGYVSHKFLKLPNTIGLVLISLLVSLCILAAEILMPQWAVPQTAHDLLTQFPFSQALMVGALSFLLFAGALTVDLKELMANWGTVFLLAVGGVLIATALFGGGMWLIFGALGVPIPFAYCIVLGAILSPTDPVAVIDVLKRIGLSNRMRTIIAGESLFNDGVAVVIFSIALGVASVAGTELSAAHLIGEFFKEAGGGLVLGLITGGVAFVALRTIDEHIVEVLITLATATATYAIGLWLEISGPIAVVMAGLIIGNPGRRLAMSERVDQHVTVFWTLIDEILNAGLFLLIGFELLAIAWHPPVIGASLIAIPLALAARYLSLIPPLAAIGLRKHEHGTLRILTWGGLHGGISVALVLALPASPVREAFLTVCYAVVVFSIVVQGLTLERVARSVRQD
ncbi:MAG TPA: sodium:proton antiporter [Rhizomicrobium sp.]|nr:sodium:proton antiporter [Rhizomicrobium sp.]